MEVGDPSAAGSPALGRVAVLGVVPGVAGGPGGPGVVPGAAGGPVRNTAEVAVKTMRKLVPRVVGGAADPAEDRFAAPARSQAPRDGPPPEPLGPVAVPPHRAPPQRLPRSTTAPSTKAGGAPQVAAAAGPMAVRPATPLAAIPREQARTAASAGPRNLLLPVPAAPEVLRPRSKGRSTAAPGIATVRGVSVRAGPKARTARGAEPSRATVVPGRAMDRRANNGHTPGRKRLAAQ